MMSELAGYFFTGKGATVKHVAQAILQQVGTPVTPCILRWPNFNSTLTHSKQPWPASVNLSLGRDGVKLLEQLLCMEPSSRTLY
jgi:hypothetical protein